MFRNRNFQLQNRNFWVDPVLGTKFHESRSKTAIIREEMAIFQSPCISVLVAKPIVCEKFLLKAFQLLVNYEVIVVRNSS